MENTVKVPVIIDTDPGDDDAASILWVLASGKFDVKAITVTNGNVGVDWCAVNALRTLEVFLCIKGHTAPWSARRLKHPGCTVKTGSVIWGSPCPVQR